MAHLCITEKLRIAASDVPQGMAVFQDQGHLMKFVPPRRYATFSDALLAVTRAAKRQEAEDAELGSILTAALAMICEISPRGHSLEIIMWALEAGMPSVLVARALKVIGYNIVLIGNEKYLSGSIDGRAGYLRLRM